MCSVTSHCEDGTTATLDHVHRARTTCHRIIMKVGGDIMGACLGDGRELGLPFTSVLGIPPPTDDGSTNEHRPGLEGPYMPPSEEWLVSPLWDPLSAVERIANFFAPHGKADPYVTVPNVCGLRGRQAWWPAASADLRISVVRLTEHPKGDGIIGDQDPPAGTRIRRHSTLTIQVVHDSSDQAATRDEHARIVGLPIESGETAA